MAAILANPFKGEEEEFARLRNGDRYASYNPPEWVSLSSYRTARMFHPYTYRIYYFPNRIGGARLSLLVAPLLNQRATLVTMT